MTEANTTQLLTQLKQELHSLKKMLGQASDTIINQGVSKYPIFAVHQQELELGIPLVKKGQGGQPWSVNASSLEEFVVKKLIHQEKVKDFKKIYKLPTDYACLFVLSELGATFVFLPRI